MCFADNRSIMIRRKTLIEYGLAIFCVMVAWGVRSALDPFWGGRLPYATFFLANLALMRFVSAGPFLLATVAGFVLGDWYFVSPRQTWGLGDRVDHLNAVFYFLISSILLLLSVRTRRALLKEQTARDALRRNIEELRESEARYCAVVRNSLDAILLTDAQDGILAANVAACRMFGRSEEELCGLNRLMLVDPGDRERIAQSIGREADKSNVRLEVTFLRNDGTRFFGEVSIARFTDRDGLPKLSSIIRDVTERKQGEAHLESLHKELVAASRQAGMAEIASSVLHNVGNVLNTVNVSATVVQNQVRGSKMATLGKVLSLLREHQDNLAAFLTTDARGKQLIPFLASTLEHLEGERAKILKELDVLRQSVEHIKQIVAQQQSYARLGGVLEKVKITDLIEDALRMYPGNVGTHAKVVREFAQVPPVFTNRHQVLQILVNLLQNARRACEEATDGKITVRVAPSEAERVRVEVADNGVGIAPENLTRIFAHGFTTRKNGHGFGLHSGALAAKEMGGSLLAQSEGVGKGAKFILELPLNFSSR